MGLDVYFPEDIRNALAAIERTALHIEPGEFRDGFLSALSALALAFGLPADTTLAIPYSRKEVIAEGIELERR